MTKKILLRHMHGKAEQGKAKIKKYLDVVGKNGDWGGWFREDISSFN